MHSRIFQVSTSPILVDERDTPCCFYENSSDYADYIGDAIEGKERKDDIKSLAETLGDLFDLDKTGRCLVYKGGMDEFKREWAETIRKAAEEVTGDNILESSPRYTVRMICNETHLSCSYRFKIEGWTSYAAPMDDLIEWIAYKKFKPGKKLYIGAVIDYHF